MFDLDLAFPFGAGLVAAFNPCGFAMLPTFLAYFISTEDGSAEATPAQNVRRGLVVGAVITAGFVGVFGIIGILTSFLFSTGDTAGITGWITIVVGILMVPLGLYMLAGREVNLKLPKMNKGAGSRELSSVFLFGISYAVVSLGCTIGPFLAAVSTSASGGTFFGRVATFLAYGLGMGAIVMFLTMATALAKGGVARNMRKVLPYINRISGVLLIFAGIYLYVYGRFETASFEEQIAFADEHPNLDQILNIGSDFQTWISTQFNNVGPQRLGLILGGVVIAAAVGFAAKRSRKKPVDELETIDA